MRLNEPSDGVILNGHGVREQNRGYRSVKNRVTDKNPPKISARSGEHYIEKGKFLSGDQRVSGGSLYYENRIPRKGGLIRLLKMLFSKH